PLHENKPLTWPNWPLKLRTSSSHEEGAARDFAVTTTHFSGTGGAVQKLHCMRFDDKIKPIPGSEFEIAADLVLLAMGFVHPVHEGLVKNLGLKLDQRGNVAASTDDYRTSLDKVFTAGDMRRGQSLVVWAIREGRQAAHAVDKYLMGSTLLPREFCRVWAKARSAVPTRSDSVGFASLSLPYARCCRMPFLMFDCLLQA